MKTILYEAGEVISEEEREYLEQLGEEPPLWYKQIPETEAEKSILTYAIEGLLGGNMKVHLGYDKHENCRAKLSLMNWDDEGTLAGEITVTHVLSPEERQSVREQLRKREKEDSEASKTATGIQALVLGSCLLTYDEYSPFSDNETSLDSDLRHNEENFPVYFSILFPSKEILVSGSFRIIYASLGTLHSAVATKADEMGLYVQNFALSPDHFHYHNPPVSRARDVMVMNNDASDDRDDTYEDWFSSLSWEDRNNMDLND